MIRMPAILTAALAGAVSIVPPVAAIPESLTDPTIQKHAGLSAAFAAAANDDSLILLVFGAVWCGPCRALKARTLAATEFQEGAAPLHLVQIDVDRNREIVKEYGVRRIPDLKLLSAAGRIVAQRQGFVAVGALMKWLAEGREQAAQGAWEGLAAAADVRILRQKSRHGTLAASDLKEAVRLLGARDPARRMQARKLLLAHIDLAIPEILKATDDPYLGNRVGAMDFLLEVVPTAPRVDPWVAANRRAPAVAALQAWWSGPGKEMLKEAVPTDGGLEATGLAAADGESDPGQVMTRAIAKVFTDNPVVRTNAMSTLVAVGSHALPSVRVAIDEADRRGDERARSSFEEVRWAILIPAALGRRLPGVRRRLVSGAGPERREAVADLGTAGAGAAPALAELIADPDSLVREHALWALLQIGGRTALESIAGLLSAADSNLRMTAALALGKSKQADAAGYLYNTIDDDNEVVVCTALKALEELGARKPHEALKGAIADPRWRVRAMAAKVIGNLKIKDFAPLLKRLIDDGDPFVVKSALAALRKLGSAPSMVEIRSLMSADPALIGVGIEFLADNSTAAIITEVKRLFATADATQRITILQALAQKKGELSADDTYWHPFLTKVQASRDAAERRLGAAILENRSYLLAFDLLPVLLDDSDPRVLTSAAVMAIRLAAFNWGFSADYAEERKKGPSAPGKLKRTVVVKGGKSKDKGERTNAASSIDAQGAAAVGAVNRSVSVAVGPAAVRRQLELDFGILNRFLPSAQAKGIQAESNNGTKTRGATAVGPADPRKERQAIVREAHEKWHKELRTHVTDDSDPRVALAVFVTGDGIEDLGILSDCFAGHDLKSIFRMAHESDGYSLFLARLETAEGRRFLADLCESPDLHVTFIRRSVQAPGGIKDVLFEPARVIETLARAGTIRQRNLVELLVNQPQKSAISLFHKTRQSTALLNSFAASEVPMARAIAVYIHGVSGGTQADALIHAAKDSNNDWIRYAAAQALTNRYPKSSDRERFLEPFLRDANADVVYVSAAGLLQPQLRLGIDVDRAIATFRYEQIYGRTYRSRIGRSNKQPEVLKQRPEFIGFLRGRFDQAKAFPDEKWLATTLALTLSQYGDHRGIDWLTDEWVASGEPTIPKAVALGLQMNRQAKYLDVLRDAADRTIDDRDLHKLLGVLNRWHGRKATQLRSDIRNRLRRQKKGKG